MCARIDVRTAIFLAAVFCFHLSSGQELSELKNNQARLAQKIAFTNKLLSENTTRKTDVELHLSLLNKQIESRRQLASSLAKELRIVQEKQELSLKEISKLKTQRENLITNYGDIVRVSYRSKLLKNRWLFLLSAHSLQQVFQRWRYLKQLNGGVKKQLNQISEMVKLMDAELASLKEIENQKKKLLVLQKGEKQKLDENLAEQKTLLTSLQKEEKGLRSTLKSHHKAQESLKKAIMKAIAASGEGREGMPLTPTMAKLSNSFVANKSKLPWPVSKGIVTRNFGKQTHPTLRNVTVVNNGIDIQTEPGSAVTAVFDGKVVGHQYIPGHDHMIIISHGNFYSVYSYLSVVTLQIGDEVKTGDVMGVSRTKDGIGQVHLEIWQGKELLDPQIWLKMH